MSETTVLTTSGDAAADDLAIQTQRELSSLGYPNKAIESLASYAAVQLAQAQEPKERKDWWDRCLAAAKVASPRASTAALAEKRRKLRALRER